jgi:hypothetical protein
MDEARAVGEEPLGGGRGFALTDAGGDANSFSVTDTCSVSIAHAYA